jgi:hypothetical protein
MLKWIDTHPELAALLATLALYVFASVVGAFLPAESRLGQVLRQIVADIRNQNLRMTPPAEAPKDTP